MDDPTWMPPSDLRRELVRLRQAIAEHADTVCAADTPAVAAAADRQLWRHVDADPCRHDSQQQINAGHAAGWLCLQCDRIVEWLPDRQHTLSAREEGERLRA